MLRIGVLGAGHLGKIHIKCLKELENFELEYFKEKLKNADPEVRKELEDKFGGLETFRKAQKN